jgi:hypothetical protein
MPNWCFNQIRIEAGDPAMLESILTDILDDTGQLDFNRIVPRPKILDHTASGRTAIDGETLDAWYCEATDAGPIERKFTPQEQAELAAIGVDNWYDWSVAHWGTKWNATDTQVERDRLAGRSVEIRFDTAWSPPTPVLGRLRALYPEATFEFRCRYEDDPEFPHEIDPAEDGQ